MRGHIVLLAPAEAANVLVLEEAARATAFGVGRSFILAAIAIVGRSFAFCDWLLFTLPVPLSIAVGVGSSSSG